MTMMMMTIVDFSFFGVVAVAVAVVMMMMMMMIHNCRVMLKLNQHLNDETPFRAMRAMLYPF